MEVGENMKRFFKYGYSKSIPFQTKETKRHSRKIDEARMIYPIVVSFIVSA